MNLKVDLLGVPFDLGGGRSGARYGPDALIRSGLIEELKATGVSSRYHDLRVQGEIKKAFDTTRVAHGRVHFEHEVAEVAGLVSVYTFASLRRRHLPVVLGGDHSISIGSVGAALHPEFLCGRTLGLVWIDAHLDAHTHLTTHSCRAHGLPLATLLGYGPRRFLNCVHSSIRDSRTDKRRRTNTALSPLDVIHIGRGEDHCESEEHAFFEEHQIPQFSRKYLQEEGWSALFASLQEIAHRVDHLWVSLDLDSLDNSIAPGVYYPNPNGLLREEILSLASVLSHSGKVCGIDIMEYNPQFEKLDEAGRAITAHTATEFLLQLLGK